MSAKHINHYLLTALIMLVGIIVSLIAFLTVLKMENHKILVEFNNSAENFFSDFSDETKSDLQVLTSVQAFFNLHKEQSREEFHSFVQHLLLQHEAINALAWIPRVPRSLRGVYERKAKQDGLPGFQITEQKSKGVMIRAGIRPEVFPCLLQRTI